MSPGIAAEDSLVVEFVFLKKVKEQIGKIVGVFWAEA